MAEVRFSYRNHQVKYLLPIIWIFAFGILHCSPCSLQELLNEGVKYHMHTEQGKAQCSTTTLTD